MFTIILVANTAEAFKKILLQAGGTKEGKQKINHELTLSQRAFFWESNDKIVITPYPIPVALFEANKAICGFKNVVNVAPKAGSIDLSASVMKDKRLLKLIAGAVRDNSQITLSPYAVTQEFLQLLDKLKIGSKEKPLEESLWTTSYLDAKVGFRAEILRLGFEHKEIKVPEGFVAQDATEALQIAEWFYQRSQPSVMKVNFGESGWGLKILRPEEYPSLSVFREGIRKTLKSDVIWEKTSIIVERFIELDTEVAGGSPSTEIFVNENGASVSYNCGQVLNEYGVFLGVEIGKSALSSVLSRKLSSVGNIIGKRYWELGYRGYFDIDFIVAKDGEIYIAETNTRRTGGTHTYDLAKHLFGVNWEKEVYLLSYDSFMYGRKKIAPEKLLAKVNPLLYPIKNQKKGIVLTLISEWSPVLGYIVIASNRSEGLSLQEQLLGIFSK